MKIKILRKPLKQDGWFAAKNYPHIDSPVSFATASKFALFPKVIATHDFLPFMAYSQKVRRYKGKKGGVSIKNRPIKYASHLDGSIYSYYSLQLTSAYEARVAENNLHLNAIGYRKGRGSNIHMAREAISEIQSRNSCVAIALDISDFFGHIDHKNLEAEWCNTLKVQQLPKDQLQVFLSLTKWCCVDKDKLINRIGLDPKKLPRRLIKDMALLRTIRKEEKNRNKEDRIFTRNENGYGIPQGSPMSALLSNIYMLPFDLKMKEFAETTGGFYRRYSDDILFICDQKHKDLVLKTVDLALKERGSELLRNLDKDHISNFSIAHGSNILSCDKDFQYLGFTFNGKNTLIRSQTLAKFHRRLKQATRAAKAIAYAKNKGKDYKIHRAKLNEAFTHLGKSGFIGAYAKKSQRIVGKKEFSKQLKGNYQRITIELQKRGKGKATRIIPNNKPVEDNR